MTSLETIKGRLIGRYGMSEKTADNVIQNKNVIRIFEIVAMEDGLLTDAARESLNMREAALQKREEELAAKVREAERMKMAAETKCREVDDIIAQAEEIKRRNEDIDRVIPELETGEARDKLRMLKLYDSLVETVGGKNTAAYIKGIASILGGRQ